MKLKGKLILFSALICIVSVVSISAVNYFLSIKELESEIHVNHQLETTIIAQDIDKWVALQKDSLEEVLYNLLYTGNYETDFVHHFFVEKNKINPGNGYYIAFSDKTFIDSAIWTPGSDYDPTSRDWYTGAKQAPNSVYISEPYVDADTGKMLITISKLFKTPEGREGVIASDIKVDFIVDFISNIAFEDGSYAFLVESNGNIITHRNSDFNPTDESLTNLEDLFDGKLKTIMTEKLAIRDTIVKDYDNEDRSFYFASSDESNWKIGLAVPIAASMKTINRVINYTLMTTIIVILVSLLLSVYIANNITKPITESVKIAENISNLDLSKSIEKDKLNRKDEIGQLYTSFQLIIEKLGLFMSEMENSLAINRGIYHETMDKLQYLVSQAEDTSATTEELSAGMEETAASTLSINESTAEINSAISDFAAKVGEGASTSGSISTKADTLSKQFIRSREESMNVYMRAKEEIEKAIEAAKEVSKINTLTDAISDISEQTGLLSLNASIEAARAGESGRGFAVVASEIGKLANHSNDTVEEIQMVTINITNAVNQLVNRATHILEFLSTDVSRDYEAMVEAILNYKEDGASLNHIIADLSATSEELAATVNEISSSMKEISVTVEESTKATTNIAEKNTSMVETIVDINEIMGKNEEVSAKLERIIHQVKL